MDNLKPCPFCGDEKIIVLKTSINTYYVAACEQCGARTDVLRREQVPAAWNRRAASSATDVTAGVVPSSCAWCSDQDNIDRQKTVFQTCPVCSKEIHQSGNLRFYENKLARSVASGESSNQQLILMKIIAERVRQDEKWGFPQQNNLSEWGNILGEEYGEYCKALNELVFGRTKEPDEMIDELIQVAAVAVGILEHLAMDGGIRP